MTKKRIATLATCLTLVGAVAVGGTLALLTSQVENLQNTFTVGDNYDTTPANPDFILRESDVKQGPDGGYVDNDGEDVTEAVKNEYKNLVSNTTLWKDPTFTLRNANEDGKTPPDSWVVAKLDQADIEAMANANIKFDDESVSTGWYLVTGQLTDGTWEYSKNETPLTYSDLQNLGADDGETKYYFIYNQALEAGQSTAPLFTKLSVGTVNENTVATNLDVFGVAVQVVEGYGIEGNNDTNNLNEVMNSAAKLLDDAVAATHAGE